MLSHIADHVVIDKTFLVLVRIHQTLIAYAVNHPRNTGGDLEHPVNGGVGEDILPAAGIPQMRLYVSFTVCPVQWRQRAVHIDSLPDCCIPLKFKLIIQQDNNLSYDNVYYIHKLFQLMDKKKRRHIVEMMLNLSRLPMKHPCTFDNFDFTRFHGHEADELENLQTLSMLESRQNLLLVGPQGVGKTHLAMAVGHKCCEKGLKTYFLKASELNDKFTAALRDGQREKIIRRLVKPTCLIIDEFGYCDFDKENTRLFFDVVDRRYSKDVPNTTILTSNVEPDKWIVFF